MRSDDSQPSSDDSSKTTLRFSFNNFSQKMVKIPFIVQSIENGLLHCFFIVCKRLKVFQEHSQPTECWEILEFPKTAPQFSFNNFSKKNGENTI